jgi:hypothetical protein
MQYSEALQLVRDLILVETEKPMTDAQEVAFRIAWFKQRYEELNPKPNYAAGYIERTIAPSLWKLLSKILKCKVTRKSLQSSIEQYCNKQVQSEGTPNSSTVVNLTVNAEYCPAQALFHQRYQETFEINLSDEATSDLSYVFIHTRTFNRCKTKLQRIIERYNCNSSVQRAIQDVGIWSLLGNAELLMTFRASEDEKHRFCLLLEDELSDVIDAPHDGHSGIFTVNIAQEFSRFHSEFMYEENVATFVPGKRLHKQAFPYEELRSVKAFIKLRFVGDGGITDKLVQSCMQKLQGFEDVLESYCTSVDRRYITLEVHMPCGRFFRLNQLSKSLEQIITSNLLKETYLAYDLICTI